MKKRIVILILALALLVQCLGILSYAESYWTVREDYVKACESGNDNAIISAVKRLEKVIPKPESKTDYDRLATPLETAARSYERLGMYHEAKEYYQKSYDKYLYLYNSGVNYRDKLLCLDGLINHLDGHFNVYTETSTPVDYPVYHAVGEAEIGCLYGFSGNFDCVRSAKLIYVQYFTNDIKDFAWMLPSGENIKTVEIAWNVPNESLEDLKNVAAPEWEDYLKRNVDYLATLNYNVLLRFGAEVNCWPDLANHTKEEFVPAFCAAFRKIADYVHANAANVAMVYSPNQTSQWDYSFDDFYPGDEYADWVGMSSYNNLSHNTTGEIGKGTDAVYCIGNYENQIEHIRPIVEEYADRKPIMISECGFCYQSTKNVQTMEHAVKALNHYYRYLTMVFPSVKAVFYFNTDFGGESYSLQGEIGEAFVRAVGENAAMQATVSEEKKVYCNLDNFSGSSSELTLYAYTSYPGQNKITYQLDGKDTFSSGAYPYRYALPALSEGMHTVKVTLENQKTKDVKTYGIYVDSDGNASTFISKMSDVSPKKWYYEPIAYCMHSGIFKGMTEFAFEPDTTMSRAMLVTVLYRLAGEPAVEFEKIFDDVKNGKYYSLAVTWAYRNGIVNGMTEKTFAADATVSREQCAAILHRYAQYRGFDTSAAADITSRPDYSTISSYARPCFGWALYHQIIVGNESGYLMPKKGCTRAEVAKILYVFGQMKNN